MNDQDLNDIYKNQTGEEPPKALDDAILNAAKASLPQKSNNRSMWMAAASVALVVPLLLWLTLNVEPTSIQKAEDYFPQESSQPKKEAAPKPQAAPLLEKTQDEWADPQDLEEQGKITVTGSRIKRATEADMDDVLEEGVNEAEALENAPAPVPSSLEINQALLRSEFKAKKQRIEKDSIADPMMALEWQQLLEYIAQGQKEKAQALLATMQNDWPDYDFTELIEQVSNME